MMRRLLVTFAKELEEESTRAFDLWTWLPSYRAALDNHGDYASEFTPTVGDLLVEATLFIQYLKEGKEEPTMEQNRWFTECPCGEEH